MTYKLAFNESALKEWKKLGHTIQEQFKKKLRERLENPRVPASQLHGRKDQYKIKLRGAGYRLVYSVEDEIITVTVIGVGKRENDAVYKNDTTQKLITQEMLSFPSSDTTNRLSSFM